MEQLIIEVDDMTRIHEQWEKLKALHPEAILLCRIQQYYYAFNEDALCAAKTLKLNVYYTDPFKDVCRFNAYRLDYCLPHLIRAGNKVAIFDA